MPGGPIWQSVGEDPQIAAFLETAQKEGAILYSICSGAMLLGKAGLLEKRRVTTLHAAIPMLREMVPSATVEKGAYVDDGNLVTAAGSGTAIEATLHLIERLSSSAIAEQVAKEQLNYPH